MSLLIYSHAPTLLKILLQLNSEEEQIESACMLLEPLHRLLALLRASASFARIQVEQAEREWAHRGWSFPNRHRQLVAGAGAVERFQRLLQLVEAILEQQLRHAPTSRRQTMGEIIDRPALFRQEAGFSVAKPLLDWPQLEQLKLGDVELGHRLKGIGGSDANTILSGNREKILALWREKRCEQPPVDLGDNLPVMLGCWTEAFNRHWYEKVSGNRVNEVHVALTCQANSWRRCTLDGYLTSSNSIWEAKHTSAFAKPEEVLERYMPQLQHNMAVARCERAVLSVIFGNHRYEIFEVASDWVYQIELLQAELDFWDCVQTGREPVPACPPAPPRPVGVREVCLDGNNSWASAAADWLEHRQAAKIHSAACKTIKELIEPDVARAFGHGIEARRSKAGAISIRECSQ